MSDAVPAPPAQGEVEAWAAAAAHELGGALALLRGAGRLLDGHRDLLASDGQAALVALSAGSGRAQRFVDDLLDLVRSGDHRLEDAADTELDGACDAALQELGEALATAGAVVRRGRLPVARIDRAEAERVFLHLLRSAAAGGARAIEVGGWQDGTGAVVEIVDDGALPMVDPSRCQFPVPRGRGQLVGAGVSLLVCRNILERRGGAIELEHRQGDGATVVRLTLPAGG